MYRVVCQSVGARWEEEALGMWRANVVRGAGEGHAHPWQRAASFLPALGLYLCARANIRVLGACERILDALLPATTQHALRCHLDDAARPLPLVAYM